MNEFSLTLLRWFQENGRELPWRATRDPYAIWLSEIILQQTQVKQGWDYWERFMRRWPTVERLAEASEDEVLREWQGLGYYSRARNLHTAARQIVALGRFPDTLDGIKRLKGVGDYTAAAIGSIAFGLPDAVVDGNVYRVLSRHYGIATPIDSAEGRHEFAALARHLLPATEASAYNQAIMDFGALQCVPQSPRCEACPLMVSCVAFREGRVASLPVKQKKPRVRERRFVYAYVRCQGMTAIHRRGPGDIWQGLWEPVAIAAGGESQEMEKMTAERDCRLVCQGVKHVLTHQVIYADLWLWQPAERPCLPDDYIWIPEADIDRYGLPRLVEKLIKPILQGSGISPASASR